MKTQIKVVTQVEIEHKDNMPDSEILKVAEETVSYYGTMGANVYYGTYKTNFIDSYSEKITEWVK